LLQSLAHSASALTLERVFRGTKDFLLARGETVPEERMSLAQVQRLAAGKPLLERVRPVGQAAAVVIVGSVLLGAGNLVNALGDWGPVAALLLVPGGMFQCTGTVWFCIALFGAIFDDDPNHKHLNGAIFAKCKDLGALPPEIERPLSRALGAYVDIHQMSQDPAWKRAKVPVARYLWQARTRLEALLDRGQQLGKVAASLRRFDGDEAMPAHYRKVAELYQRHCEKLRATADVFEQAEAGLSRALLAMTDQSPAPGSLEEPLREMGLTFEALADALESLEEMPPLTNVKLPPGQREETVPLRVGQSE
jgi:hypothetical protein